MKKATLTVEVEFESADMGDPMSGDYLDILSVKWNEEVITPRVIDQIMLREAIEKIWQFTPATERS